MVQALVKIVKLGILIKTRKIWRATLYKLNQENQTAKQLVVLYDNLVMQELNL
jgi:hypothetical protein